MAGTGPDGPLPHGASDRSHRAGAVGSPSSGPERWIVDGNNVMGSRPDGWWRDRAGAALRLVTQLVGVARPAGTVLVVVFDGPARPGGPEPGATDIEVLYAGTDRSADDAIVALVAGEPTPPTTVFTSDAELSRRVRAEGAKVVGARSLLDLIGSDERSVRRPRRSSH